MKKVKEFLLGTSYMWLPLIVTYLAEMILKFI